MAGNDIDVVTCFYMHLNTNKMLTAQQKYSTMPKVEKSTLKRRNVC